MPSLADSLVTLLAFTLDAQMLAPSKTTATGFPTRKKDVVVFAGYQRKMATWLGSYFNWARAGLARTVAAIAIVAATKNRFMHVPPLSSRPLFHGLPPITRIAGNNCNAWRNNFSWARGASEQVTVELIVWKAPSRCASLSDQLGRALARAIAKSLSLRRCHQVADRECSAICPVMVSPIGSRQMRRTIVPFSRPTGNSL